MCKYNEFIIVILLSSNRLDENLLIKVADFGLTKDIYEKDYQRVTDKNKEFPIKWMSLEAIQYGTFTTQSDFSLEFA